MKAYSYNPAKDPEFKRFSDDLDKESDRGIALTCHAYIEDLLKRLLMKRLITNSDLRKQLERNSSFHHLLQFCCLTGIVTPKERQDIDCLSKIRNSFAHDRSVTSFDNLAIRKRFKDLSIDIPKSTSTPKRKYISTAAYYVQMLNLKMKYIKKMKLIEIESPGLKMLKSLFT